jgi:phage terminase Nu1 subunit (DNA packaging protein)
VCGTAQKIRAVLGLAPLRKRRDDIDLKQREIDPSLEEQKSVAIKSETKD